HRIPARRIGRRIRHRFRIERRFDQGFDLQTRLEDLADEGTERAALNDDGHPFPRWVFAGAFGEVRLRDSVLCPVSLEAAVHRMLPADDEAAAWPKVAGH